MNRAKRILQWLAVSPLLLLALVVVILNWIIRNLRMPRYTYWRNIWRR